MEVTGGKRGLPESAYRPLKEGEVYSPYISASTIIPEITSRSVILGAIMAAIFTLATAVSGLRAGTVFEAAIPVAILAIGLGKMFKRHNTILENVIIQSIGSASGAVVAGAIFTIPTLFMLNLEPNLVQVFFVALLGGMLGIMFLIPLRRYFVADQHGKLPFPEATAVNEILVTGEKAGKQAGVLAVAMLVGGIYDFLCDGLRFWGSNFTWRVFGDGFKQFTEHTKMVFRMDSLAFFVGLGYIVGLRYSTIIVMGSFMSWFVLVPMFGWVATQMPATFTLSGIAVADMSAEVIFRNFVQRVGIGCIAVAGIMGIIKSFPVIVSSFKIGFKGIKGRKEGTEGHPRTDRDMTMSFILGLLAVVLIVLAVFFFYTTNQVSYSLIGLVIVLVISFLFTTVAANAIAIVGTNPVSGMTLMTLILTSAILVGTGLSGSSGMFIALVIGGVVCTALSVAGAFVSDLKVGYWLGSSPFQQERFKFLGVFISAAIVGLSIILIDNAFGFLITDPVTGQQIANPAMPAPQANLMRAIIVTFMDPNAVIPWMLFGIGAIIALMMNWVGVPALAFGLGMYLPQEINTPLLLGAFVAYLLKKSSKNEELSNARFQKGTLLASGFIAGAALFKILEAILRVVTIGSEVVNGIERPISLLTSFHRAIGVDDFRGPLGFTNNFLLGNYDVGTLIGLIFILALAVWMFFNAKRAKVEEPAKES